MLPISSTRTWLIHDWLTGMRGGEKVLLELIRLLPNSRIATLIHIPGTTHPEIDARVARTSFLQNIPGIRKHYRNYLPMFPKAIRGLKLDGDCDLVISSSHAVAKGVRLPQIANHKSKIENRTPPHICYCHTPMRYIWGMESQYLSSMNPKRLALAMIKPKLRRFDLLSNRHVTQFVANSHNVAERIRTLYQRESIVVQPGVDETYFVPAENPAPAAAFYLIVSALVPYKRIDLAIRAIAPTPERPLIIIGDGPEGARLRAMAADASHIRFLGRQSDEVVRTHYQQCRALLFPGEEDFGLTPLEAQACGRPVIALARGGAMETIAPETGLFFRQPTAESLGEALGDFERRESAFEPAVIRDHALTFTWTRFRDQLRAVIEASLATS